MTNLKYKSIIPIFLISNMFLSTLDLFSLPLHLIILSFLAIISRNKKLNANFVIFIFCFSFYVILAVMMSYCGLVNNYYILNLLLIILVLSCSLIISKSIEIVNIEKLYYVLCISLFLLLTFRLFHLNGIVFGRPLTIDGVFNEPSHFAVVITPYIGICYYLSNSLTKRILIYFLMIAFLILTPSSSYIVLLLVFFFVFHLIVQFSITHVAFIVASTLITFNFLFSALEIYLNKIAQLFTIASKNVTVLVYFQGYQDAFYNLFSSRFLGIGLGSMGCWPVPPVPARQELELLSLELNTNSGSFLFSKGVSELGFLFVLFLGHVFWLLCKHASQVKVKLRRKSLDMLVVSWLFVMFFFVTSFIRGEGYYFASSMQFLPFYFYLLNFGRGGRVEANN